MSRYARNRDLSHAPIRDALRKAYGEEAVLDTANYPEFVDLVIGVRGRTLLGECKTARNKAGTVAPSQFKKSQVKLLERWQGDAVLVLTSPEQAVAAVASALARMGG